MLSIQPSPVRHLGVRLTTNDREEPTMTEYIVLLPGNEAEWAKVDEAERARVYDKHREFAAALAERGHKVCGGAELASSSEAKTVRRNDGALQITDGPYAESVEQLSGFYSIQSDNLDDLLECVGILAEGEGVIEVRRCLEM
jgi:hypothetical protein